MTAKSTRTTAKAGAGDRDTLRPDYDLASLGTGTRGKYARPAIPPSAITAKATTKNLRRYLGRDKGLWVKDRVAADFGEIIRQRRHDLYDRDLDQGSAKKAKRAKGPRMYTQAWLATRLGVANSTISAWERGKRLSLLKPGHFWMLGYLLGLSPEEMLEAAGYLAPGSKVRVTTNSDRTVN